MLRSGLGRRARVRLVGGKAGIDLLYGAKWPVLGASKGNVGGE